MKNADQPFVYTSVGTCRLADPLEFLTQSNIKDIRRDQTNIYAYIHSAKEAIQQLRYNSGTTLPDEFAPYITGKPRFPAIKERGGPDLWILEISSLKEISVDGVYLQLNHLNRKFAKAEDMFRLVFKYPEASQLSERRQRLREYPEFEQLDATDRHVLQESVVGVSTYVTMTEDLEEIRTLTNGKLVIVPHINVRNMQGHFIGNRVALATMLQGVTKDLGIEFFDNSELIRSYGETNGLQDDGADLNHYSNGIIPIVAHFMHHGLIGRVAHGLPVQAFGDLDASRFPVFDPNRKKISAADGNAEHEDDLEGPLGDTSEAQLVKLIRQLFDQRKISLARELLETHCADLDAASYDMLVFYARAIAAIGTNERRRELARVLVARFPADQRALVAAYQCYDKSKNFKEARDVLERLVTIDSDGGRNFKRLWSVQFRLGELSGAIRSGIIAAEQGALAARDFAKLREQIVRMSDPEALSRLGKAAALIVGADASSVVTSLLASGRPDLASEVLVSIPAQQRDQSVLHSVIRFLRTYCSDRDDKADPLRALSFASMLMRLGDEAGQRLLGKWATAVRNQARDMFAADRAIDAVDLLRQATSSVPNSEPLLKELAVISEKLENWPDALRAWKALDDNLSGDAYLPKAIRAARRVGDWESAIVLQAKLIARSPEDSSQDEGLKTLCSKAINEAKTLIAKAAFSEAAKLVTAVQNAGHLLAKANVLTNDIRRRIAPSLVDGNPEIADHAAKTILLMRPDDPAALKVRALLLDKAGQKAQSALLWQQLAEGRAGRATHWRKAAKLFEVAGDSAQAENAKRQAHQMEIESLTASKV